MIVRLALRLPCTALLVLCCTLLSPSVLAQERQLIRVLILTGVSNHDWEFTSSHYESYLERTLRFDVDVTNKPAEALADAARIASYDVLFMDYNGPRWGAAAEANFVRAIREDGKGLVVTHASNNAFAGWSEFEEMIGLCWREGAGHGKVHDLDVKILDYNHAITAKTLPLTGHRDELYHGLKRIPAARLRVLATAQSTIDSGGSGKEEPVALILEYGKGRIFHTTLGHVWPGQPETRASVQGAPFKQLVARGTEWVAHQPPVVSARVFDIRQRFGKQHRPRSPWVVRCTLDERPRMVVCALDSRLWVAYDMTTCSLYKVWGGDVKFDGAVYNGVHGPQPTVRGLPYHTAPKSLPWRMKGKDRSGADVRGAASFRYRGYHFVRGHVRFRYEGVGPLEGVTVLESPEHGDKGSPTLVREFIISGLPEGLELMLPDPRNEFMVSYRVSGPRRPKGPIYLPNGRTTVTLIYRPAGGVQDAQ